MADNTVINQGTGGDTIATDEIGVAKFQRIKLTLGADGVNDGDISKTNPVPQYKPSVIPTDLSGTITTGAVAQALAALNTNRKGWWLRNNSAESLWVSDLTTAVDGQPSLEIKTGELYESAYGGCSSNALSIIGATTGSAFTAREF